MKLLSLILLIASLPLMFAMAKSPAAQNSSSGCCQLVHEAMDAAQNIKPGMTRQDVEKRFRKDGGLIFPVETRYTYDECSSIKIDVDFKPSGTSGPGNFNPSDVVVRVSKPYLEGPFAD